MKELWRKVSSNHNYSVSSLGRIRRDTGPTAGKIRKLHTNKWGYIVVDLHGNGKPRLATVHRLVALAFIGDGYGMDINHKNGVKWDNSVENLEFCTKSQNTIHAYSSGLIQATSGAAHWSAKIDGHKASAIRNFYSYGFYQKDIAEKFGVSVPLVSMIVNNVIWQSGKEKP